MIHRDAPGGGSASVTGPSDVRSGLRRRLLAVASVLLSLLALALLMEIVLRWLPVNEGLRGLSVDEQNPVYRLAAHREAVYSRGWNFSIVNGIRTNNYGFVNDHDYDPSANTPLLAVIGDSFVEAVMVPFPQTGVARLGNAVGSAGRVYGFGTSGFFPEPVSGLCPLCARYLPSGRFSGGDRRQRFR